MTFSEVLIECCLNKELVKQFNRLCGTNLSFEDNRKPIERMIDEATGYQNPFKNNKEDLFKFFDFVLECVWIPLIIEDNNSDKK